MLDALLVEFPNGTLCRSVGHCAIAADNEITVAV